LPVYFLTDIAIIYGYIENVSPTGDVSVLKQRRHIMAEGQGNFGNPKQHAKAGSMSSGNTGNPEQHSEAGKKGAEAQPTEAKVKGGENSHRNR
jgi:uncharacterized protein